jgi:ABC-type nitrate/sulfonate/bicarbonate transport system permease component
MFHHPKGKPTHKYIRSILISMLSFSGLGAAVGLLEQFLFGNGIRVLVLENEGLSEWKARATSLVQHGEETLIRMLFGALLGSMLGVLFAIVRILSRSGDTERRP